MLNMIRRAAWFVVLMCFLMLSSCFLVDAVMGVRRDKDGNPISEKGDSPLTTVLDLVGSIWKPAALLAAASRWGTVEYRHVQLIRAGKKDDDNDGQEDPPVLPPPPAVAASVPSTTSGLPPTDHASDKQSS